MPLSPTNLTTGAGDENFSHLILCDIKKKHQELYELQTAYQQIYDTQEKKIAHHSILVLDSLITEKVEEYKKMLN